jgi:hypothetical protein
MQWPWVSRAATDKLIGLLERRIEQLEAERTVLYDRLGLIGLGGPLFVKDAQVEPPDEPEEPELVDPYESIKRLHALRGNPRQWRQEKRRQIAESLKPPTVARIPDMSKIASVNAAMDAAEELGRKKA